MSAADIFYGDEPTAAEVGAAAREAELIRMRALGLGWTPNRWADPQERLRQLDNQRDPVELRALSHMRESERQRDASERTTVAEALRWVREHDPRHLGPE